MLTPYAFSARYPDDDGEIPTEADAVEARQCAQHVLEWLRRELPAALP